jgi:hypothetical protein
VRGAPGTPLHPVSGVTAKCCGRRAEAGREAKQGKTISNILREHHKLRGGRGAAMHRAAVRPAGGLGRESRALGRSRLIHVRSTAVANRSGLKSTVSEAATCSFDFGGSAALCITRDLGYCPCLLAHGWTRRHSARLAMDAPTQSSRPAETPSATSALIWSTMVASRLTFSLSFRLLSMVTGCPYLG